MPGQDHPQDLDEEFAERLQLAEEGLLALLDQAHLAGRGRALNLLDPEAVLVQGHAHVGVALQVVLKLRELGIRLRELQLHEMILRHPGAAKHLARSDLPVLHLVREVVVVSEPCDRVGEGRRLKALVDAGRDSFVQVVEPEAERVAEERVLAGLPLVEDEGSLVVREEVVHRPEHHLRRVVDPDDDLLRLVLLAALDLHVADRVNLADLVPGPGDLLEGSLHVRVGFLLLLRAILVCRFELVEHVAEELGLDLVLDLVSRHEEGVADQFGGVHIRGRERIPDHIAGVADLGIGAVLDLELALHELAGLLRGEHLDGDILA